MLLDDDLTRLRHIIDAAKEAVGYVEDIPRAEFDDSRLAGVGFEPTTFGL